MRFTNIDNLSISVAVWLAADTYKYNDNPNVISATSLLKPIREIVLSRQNCDLEQVADLTGMIASRVGNSYHDGIEKAWKNKELRNKTLKTLGYPDHVINKIRINPTAEECKEDIIPVYLELRSEKDIEGFTISGQLDFCIEGRLEDFKSTSVFAKIFGSNVDAYIRQGSIYRWLRSDIITDDHITIQYIFTDWTASKAKQDKNYPQKRILSAKYPLMSLAETEAFIRSKLKTIKQLAGATQEQLPLCTKEELWQKDPVWKYYKDPNKTVRATKNFDNPGEATQRWNKDGRTGLVVEVPGEVKRCTYCKVNQLCEQAHQLKDAGIWKPE